MPHIEGYRPRYHPRPLGLAAGGVVLAALLALAAACGTAPSATPATGATATAGALPTPALPALAGSPGPNPAPSRPAASPAAPATPAAGIARPAGLYATGGPNGSAALLPLDAEMLADRSGSPVIDPGSALWTLSADGSTAVSIAYPPARSGQNPPPDRVTIVVRDGVAGPERARFHPPAPVVVPLLSRDGTRLAVARNGGMPGASGPQPTAWYVLDTADGRLLATATATDYVDPGRSWLAPDGRHLYSLAVPNAAAGGINNTGPRPVTIVAYDLATGAESGRLALPDVLAGSWQTDRAVGDEPVIAQLTPGAALSPDGRALALVHADADRVTLVDTERLVVARTFSLARGPSLLERLGLAPRGAAAKAVETRTRQAVFGPDGQRLYIFGGESTVNDRGETVSRGLGLRVVDVQRGTPLAEALPGATISQVLPAPDGRSVYVAGVKPGESGLRQDTAYLVRRLDAATLAPRAEREFAGYRSLVFLPARPPAGAR